MAFLFSMRVCWLLAAGIDFNCKDLGPFTVLVRCSSHVRSVQVPSWHLPFGFAFSRGARGGDSFVGRTQARDPKAKPEVGRGLLGKGGACCVACFLVLGQ